MTARATARKAKASPGVRVRVGLKKGIARVEKLSEELPSTLDEFSKRMHKQLSQLERDVERAETRARREIARVLRQASHRLGRFEAEGEKQWKRLTTQARRDALALLHKLEARLEPKKKVVRRRSA